MIKKLVFIIFTFSMLFGQDTDSLNVKTPKRAALWSILPGGGQIYNGKYVKAGIIITLESLAVWQSIENGNKYKNDNLDSHLTDRNKYAWWAFLVHIYGTLDAVVDNHLKPFDKMMDEKLPEEIIEKEEMQSDGE